MKLVNDNATSRSSLISAREYSSVVSWGRSRFLPRLSNLASFSLLDKE